jgi:dTDP-4-amino-4,6-dideoxygalactose transaminase
MGDFGCFSFFPSKNLGGLGDGGMVTARTRDAAQLLARLRVHGSERKYFHEAVGYNSRLDSLQAAALSVKLKYLDAETDARGMHAERYRALLAGVESSGCLRLPRPAPWQTRHVNNQYVIAAERRDELKHYLAGRGVGTEIYYPLPLHLQQCFAELGYRRGDFPVAECAAARVLALPVHSALSQDDLSFVAEAIVDFYRS